MRMKTTIHALSILALITAHLTATSMLTYDAPPSVLATGKCYDILDPRASLTRTYSGMVGIIDKTGILFFHNGSADLDIASENLFIGVKADLLKGVRFGGYVSYLGYGTFENRNERSVVLENFTPSDLLIGVPVVFCSRALNLVQTGTNRNGWYDFLNLFTAGININYYQSSIGDTTARTFFADINTGFRFKLPYIGMPENLISEADLERERERAVTMLDRDTKSKIAALAENKALAADARAVKESEYQTRRTALLTELNDRYTKKKEDVRAVHAIRAKLFETSRDLTRDIDGPYMNTFMSNVMGEVVALLSIASNTVRENGDALAKITASDIENNGADIDFYKRRLEKYAKNPDLVKKAGDIAQLYDNYLANKSIDFGEVTSDDTNLTVHTVDAKDTPESISQKYTGTTDNASRILVFNGITGAAKIKRGSQLRIPDAPLIAKLKEREEKQRDHEEKLRGYREYRVQSTNETWSSISQKFYNADRVKTIIMFNGLKDDAKLFAGQTLKLPIENLDEQKRERANAFRARAGSARTDAERNQSEVERLLFGKFMKTLDKRVALYEYRDRISVETMGKYLDLRNTYANQANDLESRKQDALRELKKISLKKELDIVNASAQADREDALREYKRKEKVIFGDLLVGIYQAKREIINQLKTETEEKGLRQLSDIDSLYAKKDELLKEDLAIARIMVGENKEKIAQLEASFSRETAKNATDKADELAAAKKKMYGKSSGLCVAALSQRTDLCEHGRSDGYVRCRHLCPESRSPLQLRRRYRPPPRLVRPRSQLPDALGREQYDDPLSARRLLVVRRRIRRHGRDASAVQFLGTAGGGVHRQHQRPGHREAQLRRRHRAPLRCRPYELPYRRRG